MNLRAKFDTSRLVGMVAMVLVSSLLGLLPRASADTVTVNSGSAVTFLNSGFVVGDFPSPFTMANFTAAQTGTAASALTSTPFYISSLPDGPGAVWIGTNPSAGTSSGNTALYAISFDLASTVSSASLNLYYAVDNILGESNPGIYINGVALPSSTGLLCSLCTTSFTQENHYTDANIGSLLVSGTNWLYFDAVNQGGPAGLIFSANITTETTTATPEPPSVLLLGIGVLSLFAFAGRGKRFASSSSC